MTMFVTGLAVVLRGARFVGSGFLLFVGVQVVALSTLLPAYFLPRSLWFVALFGPALVLRSLLTLAVRRVSASPGSSGFAVPVGDGDSSTALPADGGGPPGRPSAAHALVDSVPSDDEATGSVTLTDLASDVERRHVRRDLDASMVVRPPSAIVRRVRR